MAKSKSILDLFSAAYARWMSKALLSGLNDALLKAVLRARGYQDWSGSGERWFCAKVLPQVNPHVVLDVGAHRGDYALGVLKNTQAEVHCFEPQPHLCRQMQHNLAEYTPPKRPTVRQHDNLSPAATRDSKGFFLRALISNW